MISKFLSQTFNKISQSKNAVKTHVQKHMPAYAGAIGATVAFGVTALFLTSVLYPEEFIEKRDNLYQSVVGIFTSDAPTQDMTPD